jgi:MFS family permease
MRHTLPEEHDPLPHTDQSQPALPPILRTKFAHTFSALRHRNYRLWFAGQLVSMFGTWMQTTAQGFLIFELTNSAAYLGYVSFATGVPTWLLTLYGGVIADRISRRNLLVITQTSMMLLAFILAGLTFLKLVQPWHVILLAFLLGTANAFDTPARQSFVLEMVGRDDLTNAIALNSALFNSATAVGPAVAGLTYALVGPAWCFTINGVTFIAVITALLLMRFKHQVKPAGKSSAIRDMGAGLRYAASHQTIRLLIAGLGIVSLFGLGFIPLMPAWAVNVLGGDVRTNGLLQSARGLGALLAALMIAYYGGLKSRGKLLTLGSFIFPSLLIVFALVHWLPLSLVVLVGVGWGFMLLVNLSNALVQTQVPDELRGRVMSIFTLAFFGLFPVGSLIAGSLADVIGEPPTVLIGAIIVLVVATLAWLRFPQIRRLL